MATGFLIIGLCAIVVAIDSKPEPIRVIIDGQQVGTLAGAGVVYEGNEIRIETAEGVFGCQIDQIFNDEFKEMK